MGMTTPYTYGIELCRIFFLTIPKSGARDVSDSVTRLGSFLPTGLLNVPSIGKKVSNLSQFNMQWLVDVLTIPALF